MLLGIIPDCEYALKCQHTAGYQMVQDCTEWDEADRIQVQDGAGGYQIVRDRTNVNGLENHWAFNRVL